MNFAIRSKGFSGFRRGLFLLGIISFVAVVPSLIGQPASLSVSRAKPAPLQSGGAFEIKPSVIAGGGGTSTGGTMRVDGTIGQSVLGASSGGNFSVLGGFWQGAQQPNSTFTISGTVSNCASSTPPGVNGVTVGMTGSEAHAPVTNSTGFYTQDTTTVSGIYTVTPTKATYPPATAGIDTGDVIIARRLFLNLQTPVGCQTAAGDVQAPVGIDTGDVIAIRRFFLGFATGIGNAGQWQFTPSSPSVGPVGPSNVVQDFSARLLGDVNGSVGALAGPTPQGMQIAQAAAPLAPASVSLPAAIFPANATNMFAFVNVTDTTGNNYIGFQCDFTFDSNVITFATPPTSVSTAGITAIGWNIQANILGAGQIKTLRITADTNDGATPLSGSGQLFRLNMVRVGANGTSTPLSFPCNPASPPCIAANRFLFFEGTGFSFVDPAAATNGTISIGPTAVNLSSCQAIGYDEGVYLNWKTGFESENLGFNLYREVDGQRIRINPDLIAGSALMVGTSLQAGQSYGWWDNIGGNHRAAKYWVEEIDLNGLRTIHGPFGVRHLGGGPPRESQAELLSHVGKGAPTLHQLALTNQPERANAVHAEVSTMAAAPKLSSLPALKLSIREEGWYRVTQQDLRTAGFDAGRNPRNLQLYLNGIEQPIRVVGEQDGSADAIEFFATGQDKPTTDARVYWLVSGDSAGSRIGVVKSEGKSSGVPSFAFTVERRDKTVYFSSLRNGDADNFFGQVVTSTPVDQVINLRHLDSKSSDQAEVEVALQGVTDQATGHSVRVMVNGLQVGTILFGGQSNKAQKFTISRELLKEGDNIVTLAAETAEYDVSLVDYIRVTYPHSYTTDQDSLRMNVASGSQTVEGFSDGTVRVFDITDPSSPIELVGKVFNQGGSYAVSLEMAGQGTRTLLALTDSRIKTPASISLNGSSNWRNKKNKADLLIITRREFFGALEPLKALRESQGLRVQMVDIGDVFDEFNDGERGPQAVKDFLSYAATTWKRKPAFVLFAGHASLDPKNHLGFGDSDIVPTRLIDTGLMETASDDWFADFNNDGLPELAVGRLPFRTQSEAATMVSKIVAYDAARPSKEALVVSDANDGFDFEAASGQVRDLLPANLNVNRVNRGGVEADVAKSALIDSLNRGQKIVNYLGHGSVNQWKGNLLTNDDALSLTNADHLSLFVMMTCLNGYFQDASLDSLAESLLKAERGGAVAVWASSGMTGPGEQASINQELYRRLFGGVSRELTLGEAVVKAKAATGDADVRRTWVLLGDPSMRIK